MPSRTEGYGLAALEALSAGLPVLVSANSGFGEALRKVPFGSGSVIHSEEPDEWAKEIKKVWAKDRATRLQESKTLLQNYTSAYNWEEQIRDLVHRMTNIGSSKYMNSIFTLLSLCKVYLTIIPRAQMGTESIAHDAEG